MGLLDARRGTRHQVLGRSEHDGMRAIEGDRVALGYWRDRPLRPAMEQDAGVAITGEGATCGQVARQARAGEDLGQRDADGGTGGQAATRTAGSNEVSKLMTTSVGAPATFPSGTTGALTTDETMPSLVASAAASGAAPAAARTARLAIGGECRANGSKGRLLQR